MLDGLGVGRSSRKSSLVILLGGETALPRERGASGTSPEAGADP